MNRLYVDVGNSRVKWALAGGTELGPMQADVHEGDPGGTLHRVLAMLSPAPEEIVLVDVSGRVDPAAFGIRCRKIEAGVRGCGVENGYTDPAQLGADRWAALVAARARLPGEAACVVDCGTALTLDLLDADGRHLGGAIAPGLRALERGLYRDTAIPEVGRMDRDTHDEGWGLDTAAAVAAGTRLAFAGFLERGIERARASLGAGTTVLATGGDAPRLPDGIAPPVVEAPALVLEGALIWTRETCAR